jgi:hypothetical protein
LLDESWREVGWWRSDITELELREVRIGEGQIVRKSFRRLINCHASPALYNPLALLK